MTFSDRNQSSTLCTCLVCSAVSCIITVMSLCSLIPTLWAGTWFCCLNMHYKLSPLEEQSFQVHQAWCRLHTKQTQWHEKAGRPDLNQTLRKSQHHGDIAQKDKKYRKEREREYSNIARQWVMLVWSWGLIIGGGGRWSSASCSYWCGRKAVELIWHMYAWPFSLLKLGQHEVADCDSLVKMLTGAHLSVCKTCSLKQNQL